MRCQTGLFLTLLTVISLGIAAEPQLQAQAPVVDAPALPEAPASLTQQPSLFGQTDLAVGSYDSNYLQMAPQQIMSPAVEPVMPYAGAGCSCDGGCDACDSSGCNNCGGFGAGCQSCNPGFIGSKLAYLAHCLLPYAEGGRCAPRWYDITMDVMYLTREEVSRRLDVASLGQGNGNIVLSTDNLDFNEELGFRFTGAWQMYAGISTEFTYFGLFNWTSQAEVQDPNGNLFSIYSDFGNDPPGGFGETDNSTLQQISYSSTIDSFELNVRRRWTGPNCYLQGSLLAGARFLYLYEDFGYNSVGSTGSQATEVTARNSMTGFQLGGDLWACVIPGLRLGADFKAGVYGNYMNQTADVLVTSTLPTPPVAFQDGNNFNDIAVVGEGNLQFIWKFSPNWTVRVGYTGLYLDGVALAPENFNTTAPPNFQGGTQTPRIPVANDNGNVFYHGGHAGMEWMW